MRGRQASFSKNLEANKNAFLRAAEALEGPSWLVSSGDVEQIASHRGVTDVAEQIIDEADHPLVSAR